MAYRPDSHKTLVQLIKEKREAKGLTLENVVERLPAWMKFDPARLSRVENNQRDLSFVELREIALAIDSDIVQLVTEVEKIEGHKRKR